jgi:hypothetical protein
MSNNYCLVLLSIFSFWRADIHNCKDAGLDTVDFVGGLCGGAYGGFHDGT